MVEDSNIKYLLELIYTAQLLLTAYNWLFIKAGVMTNE